MTTTSSHRFLRNILGTATLAGLTAFFGCTEPGWEECTVGTQGCPCAAPGTESCGPGLECSASNICVPSGGDTGGISGATGEDDDGPMTSSGIGDSGVDDEGDGDDEGVGDDEGDGGSPCVHPGDDCSSDLCCNGSTCVNFDPNIECAANCANGTECASCCCVPLQSAGAVCVEGFCSGSCGVGCSAVGSLCAGNGDCCEFGSGGSTCVNFPDYGGACAATCTYDSDCVSDCCAPLEGGGAVCAPAKYCGAAPPAPEPGDLLGLAAQRAPDAVVYSMAPSSAEDVVEELAVAR